MLSISASSAFAAQSASATLDRQMKAVGVLPVKISADIDSEQQSQLDREFVNLENSLNASLKLSSSDEIKTSKAKARAEVPEDLKAE